MRKDIKNRIHRGHLGIARCRSRARQVVFWPRMSAEIEEMISRCSTCQEHRSYQPKEKMVSHSVPNAPWAKVASDLFEYKKSTYVLIVDYFSNFIEVSKLPPGETKSKDVIKHTKSIFARHGIPEIVISDNGPHYSSNEYKRFAKEWEFFHTSSPKYPKGNGLAEASVKIIKKLLRKASSNDEDPYLAVLAHRTTPGNDGRSPAEKLMNRQPRSNLPIINKPVKENQVKPENKWYNANARNLPELKIGDTVRIQGNKTWDRKAQVTEQCNTPRSFKVKTEDGRVLRRNRRDLLKTRESYVPRETSDFYDHDESTSSSKVSAPTQAASSETPPSQAANSEIQDGPIRPYYTRSGREVRPPRRFQDYTK